MNAAGVDKVDPADDDDDDDIFIVHQVKPVLKLTREQALEIKKKVLKEFKYKGDKNDDISVLEESVVRKNETEGPQPKKKKTEKKTTDNDKISLKNKSSKNKCSETNAINIHKEKIPNESAQGSSSSSKTDKARSRVKPIELPKDTPKEQEILEGCEKMHASNTPSPSGGRLNQNSTQRKGKRTIQNDKTPLKNGSVKNTEKRNEEVQKRVQKIGSDLTEGLTVEPCEGSKTIGKGCAEVLADAQIAKETFEGEKKRKRSEEQNTTNSLSNSRPTTSGKQCQGPETTNSPSNPRPTTSGKQCQGPETTNSPSNPLPSTSGISPRKQCHEPETINTPIKQRPSTSSWITPRKRSASNNNSPVSRKKARSVSISPNKTITDYFSPSKTIKTENNDGESGEKDDQKPNDPSPTKKSPFKIIKTDLNLSDDLDESSTSDGSGGMRSALCCQIFQMMVQEEMDKQATLQVTAIKEEKEAERLFLREECDVISRFFGLDETSKQLYVRMVGRKGGWHRLSRIKYDDISRELCKEVMILKDQGFLDVDIHDQDINTQLNLLQKPEIVRLCRLFNVLLTSMSVRREDAIGQLLADNKKQRSVADMFKKSSGDLRMTLLKDEVRKTLGTCFKLREDVRAIFNRVILLFSLFHNVSDESKRYQEQYLMVLELLTRRTRYLEFEITPIVVFEKREDFVMFEKAKRLQCDFEAAILAKNHAEFERCGVEALEAFKNILDNQSYRIRVSQMTSFLKRYNAGAVYANILTRFCETFKKKMDTEVVVEILTLMLNQQVFATGSRGKWYELLALAYESLKKTSLAAKVILMGHRDEKVNEVKKLALQLKGRMLVKRKSNGIAEEALKERLDDVSTTTVQEPPSIEINARAMENTLGMRCVYVHDGGDNAKNYCTVEEQAIFYYKANGYTEGLHTEGEILHTIYYLFFFDIIYKNPPPGVFQSSYQEFPLDFHSSAFYENRKAAIDIRLEEMDLWTADVVRQRIKEIFIKHGYVKCVIPWRDKYNADMFCDIISCLGIPAVKAICTRLVKNFSVTRSGFPDLTLWNVTTKKCKFVEVKSPNDKLSPNQRLWLDFLRNIGVDCEVCNVKNVASRRLR